MSDRVTEDERITPIETERLLRDTSQWVRRHCRRPCLSPAFLRQLRATMGRSADAVDHSRYDTVHHRRLLHGA